MIVVIVIGEIEIHIIIIVIMASSLRLFATTTPKFTAHRVAGCSVRKQQSQQQH